MFEAYYKSPIGNLRIISNEQDIIKIEFSDEYFKMKLIPILLLAWGPTV